MYESHFGLEHRPFAATPQLNSFVAVPPATYALDRLIRAVDTDQGIAILSGAAGTGKTQLCLELKRHFEDSFHAVFLANSSFTSVRPFLQAVLFELGETYMDMDEHELRLAFLAAAKRIREDARATLLIIDEAQFLGRDVLLEIRSLASQVVDGESLVRTVLAGQLEFEETLAEPALDAFNQRIGCHVLLETLTRPESVQYIQQRVDRFSGDSSAVFSDDALRVIAHAADGLPRGINQLCDQTLMMAFATKAARAEESHVHEALDILKMLPLHWNIPSRTAEAEVDSVEQSEVATEVEESVEPTSEVSPLDELFDTFASPAEPTSESEADPELMETGVVEFGEDFAANEFAADDIESPSSSTDADVTAFEFGHVQTEIETANEFETLANPSEDADESIEFGDVAEQVVADSPLVEAEDASDFQDNSEFHFTETVAELNSVAPAVAELNTVPANVEVHFAGDGIGADEAAATLPKDSTVPTTFGDLTPSSWGLEIEATPVINEPTECELTEPIETFDDAIEDDTSQSRTIDDCWPEHSDEPQLQQQEEDSMPVAGGAFRETAAEELVVVDRYAFLDSGRSIDAFEQRLADVAVSNVADSGQPEIGQPEICQSASDTPSDADVVVEESAETESIPANDEPEPIQEDIDTSADAEQIEAERSDESPLWNALQQATAEEHVFVEESATAELEHWTSDAPDDEETRLGSAVLEVCREAQRAIESGSADRSMRRQFMDQAATSATRLDDESSELDDAIEPPSYDSLESELCNEIEPVDSDSSDESAEYEVEPVQEAPLPTESRQSILREALGQSHSGRSPVRTPKFSQLFTRLRRRQLEG